EVELRDGAVWQDRLSAGPSVAGNEPFDVHRRREEELLERIAPGLVVRPALHRQEALCGVLAEALRRGVEHLLLLGGRRTCLATEVVDRRIAVGVDESRERLHEMERRAVQPRAVRGVHVDPRTAAPRLTARDELDLNDAL